MRSLWPRIRGLVLFGWLVAFVRFVLEASVKPELGHPATFVSVYYLMPVAFLVVGLKGILDDLRWPRIALAALLVGLLVWGIPNLIVYATGQFLGWTHGRFEPGTHGAPIGATPLAKLGWSLAIAGGTAVSGALWSLIFLTLFVWLPGLIRRRRRSVA